MRKAAPYILMVICLFAIACETQTVVGTTTIAVSDTVTEEDTNIMVVNDDGIVSMGATAKNSLDIIGTYKGVLPCADCEGIETIIEIKSDSTYSREMKYLSKKNQVYTATGTWAWASEFVISLGSIKEGPNRYFVAEGKLVQLDMSGKKISGALANKYELKKL